MPPADHTTGPYHYKQLVLTRAIESVVPTYAPTGARSRAFVAAMFFALLFTAIQ